MTPLIPLLFGLDWHAWFTLVLIIAMLVVLSNTKIPTGVVCFVSITLLLVTGTIPQERVLASISDESVITVGVLFMLVAGMVSSGLVQWIATHWMGTPSTYPQAIVRLMVSVSALTAVLSNQAVVAMFINIVRAWVNKLRIAPGKLFIPLSYAASMGGICTLIGTPHNLIISSYYTEQTGIQLSLFTPLLPGLFCVAVCIASTTLLSRLLPNQRKDELEEAAEKTMIFELRIPIDSPLIGQTFQDCGMASDLSFDTNNQSKPVVLSIVRFDRDILDHITPDEFVIGNDHIAVSGTPHDIGEFCRKYHLVSNDENLQETSKSGRKTIMAAGIMAILIVLAYLKVFSILTCCCIAVILMVICRCCSIRQAQQTVSWNVLMTIIGSICLGAAIQQTGLAQLAVNGIRAISGDSPMLALITLCLISTIVTEFISNAAAGATFAPIAYHAAIDLGANPVTFCVALMISVSASFASPIGSIPHILVNKLGGYRFRDFIKIGIPMNIIILAANIFITTRVFPL